jgi:hypothetical protein
MAVAPGAEAGNLSKVDEVANVGEKVEQAASTSEELSTEGGRFSGRYANGQKAYRTNVPRDANNNPIPDPASNGTPHTKFQFDKKDPNRVYSGTEFDANGQAVKRVDLSGRKGDPIPHEHPYDAKDKSFGPKQPLQQPASSN